MQEAILSQFTVARQFAQVTNDTDNLGFGDRRAEIETSVIACQPFTEAYTEWLAAYNDAMLADVLIVHGAFSFAYG
jgi:hypothetical protein